MRGLVGEYYVVLRTVLKANPHLRPFLKSCRHCGIFFLADPRNRGRTDLGCAFGCRDAHRRKRSTERSTAYNRSPAGKLKKKFYNSKRKRGGRRQKPEPEGARREEPSSEERPRSEPEGIEFEAVVVDYLRVVVSLIEGRRVGRDEIIEMLRVSMRQRSLAMERPFDYVVRVVKEENPP